MIGRCNWVPSRKKALMRAASQVIFPNNDNSRYFIFGRGLFVAHEQGLQGYLRGTEGVQIQQS